MDDSVDRGDWDDCVEKDEYKRCDYDGYSDEVTEITRVSGMTGINRVTRINGMSGILG